MPIRELRWGDFESLMEAYYGLYDERAEEGTIGISLFDERPSPDSEVAWFSNLYRAVLEGTTLMFVAEVEGRAVGSCTIAPAGAGGVPSENSHVGVLGILVDRRYRGRGLGTALFARSIEAARGKFDRVRLGVFATNVAARRLYERFGFRGTGTFPAEIKRAGRYIDLEWMTLDLTTPAPDAAHPKG